MHEAPSFAGTRLRDLGQSCPARHVVSYACEAPRIARQRPKPAYPYAVGAYSTSPRMRRADNGTHVAEGSIQSWRGSLQDLGRVARDAKLAIAEADGADPVVRVSLTDWQGGHRDFDSLDDFETATPQTPTDELNVVRIDLTSGAANATIVARRTMPGAVVSVRGPRKIEVDGLARLLFAGLMRGYVDRYPGVWRPVAGFAITMIPIGLTFGIASERDSHWSDWIQVPFVIAGIAITFLVMVNSWRDQNAVGVRAG